MGCCQICTDSSAAYDETRKPIGYRQRREQQSSDSSSDDDSQYKEEEKVYIQELLETTELPNDKNKPYWYDLLPERKPVQILPDSSVFDEEVDIAIIGGGLTGMSCALHALQEGKKVIIFEARGLCDGATGRNGGHSWPDPFLDPKQLELV